MGFLVVIAVGSVLGWLASILSRSDSGQGIAANIGVGVAGALIGALVGSQDSLLIGLSATALFLSMGGAAALLMAFNLARRTLAR